MKDLKRLVFFSRNKDNLHEYTEDIKRIQSLAQEKGYLLSVTDAQKAWEEYSDMYAAGWLYLPEDDESVWRSVFDFLKVE